MGVLPMPTDTRPPSNTSPLDTAILVDEREAARRLSICIKSMYLLRRAGKIAFVPIGNKIRYRPADLARFAESSARREAPT